MSSRHEAPRAWVAALASRPRPRLRLFCFAHAGAGGAVYRDWQAELPAEIQLCSVGLPGRDGRFAEPPATRMAPLVERIVDELLPYVEDPFALFGHSFGALVAFEVARELRRQAAPTPQHLLVSGRRAPDGAPPGRFLYALPDAELVGELRRLNAAPRDVLERSEWLPVVLPAIRADLEAAETYAYTEEPALRCPLTVYGGLEDEHVALPELAAWARHTSLAFALRPLPGGHFYLFQRPSPLVPELIRTLSSSSLGSRARAAF